MDQDQTNRPDETTRAPGTFWPGLRQGLHKTARNLRDLARRWGPRAATGVQRAATGVHQAALKARESELAGRTRQAATRATQAIQERSRIAKEQVSTWTWPRRAVAEVVRRYPMLDRAWRQFLRSFSLADRPAAPPPHAPRAAARPPAPRRAHTARTTPTRSNRNLRNAA